MRGADGQIPAGTWHLSDAHGMVVCYGPDRDHKWLFCDDAETGAKNHFTHAELTHLVNFLNQHGFKPLEGWE